jgi:TolA-binding protein
MKKLFLNKPTLFALSLAVAGLGMAATTHASERFPRDAWTGGATLSGESVQDRELEKAAARLYEGALDYYQKAAYWKAARELITILDYYPAYSKIDGVLLHLGESLYNMHMYDSASRMYRYLATKYPNSRHLSQALEGLQRIHCLNGELEESLKIYQGIAARFPDNEIIDGAHYHAGMAYFQMQNYDSTIAAFGRISSRSQYFDYGLYTTGLALLKKKASTSRLPRFKNCSSCRRFNHRDGSSPSRRI